MKKLILACVLIAASLSLFAADTSGLRVDIDGLSTKIEIQTTSAGDALVKDSSSWLKEKSKLYSHMVFPFSSEWKKAVFSFITNADGKVSLIFQGNVVPSEENKDTAWLYLKDISITQKDDNKLIALDDTLWHFSSSVENKYKGAFLKSENVFKVSYLAGVSRVIQVKGGEETTISIWYKTIK